MSVSHTVSEIFSDKEWRDLETGDKGRSRSLKRLFIGPLMRNSASKNSVTLKNGL